MIDHSLLGSVIQLEGYNLDFLLVYFSEQLVTDWVPTKNPGFMFWKWVQGKLNKDFQHFLPIFWSIL